MRRDAVVMSRTEVTARATTSPPCSAARRESAASALAWRAWSAFWRTVPVSSSSEAAVSSRLPAWLWLPLASSADAPETLRAASATSVVAQLHLGDDVVELGHH